MTPDVKGPELSSADYNIYVSFLAGQAVSLYTADDNGALQNVQSLALSGKGLPLAAAHDGSRLFAASFDGDGDDETDWIDAFARDPSAGTLTKLGSTRANGRLTHISVDRSNRFVLGASYFSDIIVVHPIDTDGTVGPEAFQMPTGRNAHHILTDESNRFAFVPNLGASEVMQLRFDAGNGRFTPNMPAVIRQPDGAGCRHMVHHPNGHWVFLANERDGTIATFAFDPDAGTLQEHSRTTCLREPVDDPWAAQIRVSGDGLQLFVSERCMHTLARWRIDPGTGALSDGVIIDVARNPRGFDLDPSGRFLVLGGLEDNRLETYAIDGGDGVPRLLNSLDTPAEPAWVEIAATAPKAPGR